MHRVSGLPLQNWSWRWFMCIGLMGTSLEVPVRVFNSAANHVMMCSTALWNGRTCLRAWGPEGLGSCPVYRIRGTCSCCFLTSHRQRSLLTQWWSLVLSLMSRCWRCFLGFCRRWLYLLWTTGSRIPAKCSHPGTGDSSVYLWKINCSWQDDGPFKEPWTLNVSLIEV